MSNFKKGDRVLVEAEITDEANLSGYVAIQYGDGRGAGRAPESIVHPHPGVPVVDLVDFFDLWLLRRQCETQSLGKSWKKDWTGENEERWQGLFTSLRAAREAAQEPEWKPTEFVAVTISDHGEYVYRQPSGREWAISPHPDDIRTEEPPEIEDVFQPARYTTKELTEIANACYDDMNRRVRDEL